LCICKALAATLKQALAMEADHTAESVEGGMAFHPKRKPNFSGK
jgi:1,4-dihydroxy-2-naphthoyl-CoA synthase